MSELRDSRWTDLVLVGAFVLVAVVVALFFLRNSVRSLPVDAASSVSSAPGP
jgi:hypothetical protein